METPPQRYLVYMTFDLSGSASRTDLQVLLARWSASIAQMMKGLPVGTVDPDRADAVPVDTGEAFELEPASLTVTVGLGPKVFTDQFGLADRAQAPRRPAGTAQRRAAAQAHRWGPVAAGLCRRPAGRLPRHPRPDPDRPGHRHHPVGGDGLRSRLRRPRPVHPAT